MANFSWPVNPSTSGPIEFLKDGNTQTVTEDTVTPANSEPLPVKAIDSSGQEVDFATEAKQDDQISELQDINTELDSQSTTLTSIDTSLNNIEAVDFATAANQTTQTTELQNINTELDDQTTILSNIESFQTTIAADVDALNQRVAGALVPETFDYQSVSYVAAGNGVGEVETVVYKQGGAAGTTVATVTLAYDAQNRVTSVTRT